MLFHKNKNTQKLFSLFILLLSFTACQSTTQEVPEAAAVLQYAAESFVSDTALQASSTTGIKTLEPQELFTFNPGFTVFDVNLVFDEALIDDTMSAETLSHLGMIYFLQKENQQLSYYALPESPATNELNARRDAGQITEIDSFSDTALYYVYVTKSITFTPISYDSPREPIETCADSDAGNEPDVSGTVTHTLDYGDYQEVMEYMDSCNKDTLQENICNNTTPAQITIDCPHGCSNGKCLLPAPPADVIQPGVEFIFSSQQWKQFVVAEVYSSKQIEAVLPANIIQLLDTRSIFLVQFDGALAVYPNFTTFSAAKHYYVYNSGEEQRFFPLPISDEPSVACTESDGGSNSEEPGQTTLTVDGTVIQQEQDACSSTTTLQEFSCTNQVPPSIVAEEIPCGEGFKCEEGACIADQQLEPVNDAEFRLHRLSSNTMNTGEQQTVTVIFKNTGTTTWAQEDVYQLLPLNFNSSQEPFWGIDGIDLNLNEEILADEDKQFIFQITAPDEPGSYSFSWQMGQDGEEFGEKSTEIQIAVVRDTQQCTEMQVQCGDGCCDADAILPDGTKVRVMAGSDEQDGVLFHPLDVSISPTGEVVVADALNHQVHVFNADGSFRARFGEPAAAGQPQNGNNDVMAVAVCSDGAIFSADIHSALKEFDANYTFVKRHNFAHGSNPEHPAFRRFSFPRDIICDEDHLYVTDPGNGNKRILRYTRKADGTLGDHAIFTGTSGSGTLDNPQGIALKKDNTGNITLYVIDKRYQTVKIYKNPFTDPFLIKTISGFSNPSAIAATNNRIYVADSKEHIVKIFDVNGNFLHSFGGYGNTDAKLNKPSGIFVDAAGNVYVADTYNSRIKKFNGSGVHLMNIGNPHVPIDGKLHRGGDVVFSPEGDMLYVRDAYNCRVQAFDLQGNFIRSIGKCSEKPDGLNTNYTGPDMSFSGAFHIHWATARVYFADSFHNRIAVYSLDGNYLFSFASYGDGPGKVNNPTSVRIIADKVYVGSLQNFAKTQPEGKVQIFDLDGNYLSTLTSFDDTNIAPGTVQQPISIFEDPRNGNIFVVDARADQNLQRYTSIFNAQGEYLKRFTGLSGRGMINENGEMWVADSIFDFQLELWNADTFQQEASYGLGYGTEPGQSIIPKSSDQGPNGEICYGDWNDMVNCFYPVR